MVKFPNRKQNKEIKIYDAVIERGIDGDRQLIKEIIYSPITRPISLIDINELRFKVGRYFHYCLENKIAPTISGLCLALNISRTDYYKYIKGLFKSNVPEEIKDILTKTHDLIINNAEKTLYSGDRSKVAGAIFHLINIDPENFKQKHEVKTDTNVKLDFGAILSGAQRYKKISQDVGQDP